MRGLFAASITAVAVLLVTNFTVQAAVERVEVTERTPFAGGMSFGKAGPYEKIRGVAYFALDPNAAANARIVDLKLAPRDHRGLVEFKSSFLLLRPVNADASTLLYSVNNRGNIAMLSEFNGAKLKLNDPTTMTDVGDGFLMRRGFALMWSAWTWDVAPHVPGYKSFVLSSPIAKEPGGKTITGPVENEFVVDTPVDVTTYARLASLTYEPATPDDPKAVLTTRARPDDPRIPVARASWHFVTPEQTGGPGRIWLQGGFHPGVIYELTYTAKDPKVIAAGLAGIRDLLAWFRDHPFEGVSPPRHTLIFGISQSARLIARMLHDGLDVDESGRLAFDGAFLEVAGGGGSDGFNSRFVQPTRHPSLLQERDYPSDAFPFTTAPSYDPVTGHTASLLDHAADSKGRIPKLVIANTSAEFWNREASLIGTTPDGKHDVAPAAGVRLYAFMGSQHYVGISQTRAPYTNCVSTTDHYLPMRALILALDGWTAGGAPPPPSAYPKVSDGGLTTVAAYDAVFPKGNWPAPPTDNLHQSRLNFGPRYESEGIADLIPPGKGPSYVSLVPAIDADGNDRGGVRMVEMEVPLGTHTGWNRRSPEAGFPWATARYDGSFVPFARTEAERRAANDPRPSLAVRYPTRATYVVRVRAAAAAQVKAGFLLPEDVKRTIAENVGLYDRIMAHDPTDTSCDYLFAPATAVH